MQTTKHNQPTPCLLDRQRERELAWQLFYEVGRALLWTRFRCGLSSWHTSSITCTEMDDRHSTDRQGRLTYLSVFIVTPLTVMRGRHLLAESDPGVTFTSKTLPFFWGENRKKEKFVNHYDTIRPKFTSYVWFLKQGFPVFLTFPALNYHSVETAVLFWYLSVIAHI